MSQINQNVDQNIHKLPTSKGPSKKSCCTALSVVQWFLLGVVFVMSLTSLIISLRPPQSCRVAQEVDVPVNELRATIERLKEDNCCNETWEGMAHRINRDANTIFETCRNEGLNFSSLLEGVSSEGDLASRKKHMHSCEESDESHTPNCSRTASVPVSTTEQAQGAAGSQSPVIHNNEKATARKVVVEKLKESESSPDKEEISAGPEDAGVVGDMSYKDVCLEISKSISDGAPTYNKGDHKKCYEVYKETGEKIVNHCSIEGVLQELRAALELAETQSTFTEQAWTMRHAFDAIRCGDVGLSDLTDNDKEDLSPSIEKKSMGYKDACREIVAAINHGAPTYNGGDHNGCYNTYKKCAEKIIERCSVVVVQIKLRTALDKAEKQPSSTDRAWTMRHAFDDILDESMSYKDACHEISSAISKGAPAYNKGDHDGCYSTYKQSAEKIIEQCSVVVVQIKLRTALDKAEKQPSSTDRAWTMRHAFDDILDESMSYKDACHEISSAISKGAPAYNKGDHDGCYSTYKQSAEKIIERCSVVVVQIKLRTALDKAEKQPSSTDRAWTMRHAFDHILDESMSYKDACHEISSAISKGAPAYNKGDHSRCYNIYKQTADKIFEFCCVEGVQHELRKALDDVTKQESFTTRAWTIRHAFDAILRGHFGEVHEH